MAWCKYCEGKSNYRCTIEEKYQRDSIPVPDGYDDFYCYDDIRAYANCPRVKEFGWNITTATCMKLGQMHSPVYNSLLKLKHSEFLSKKKYEHFIRIYLGNKGEKAIGSKLSGLIIPDVDNDRISEIYSKLEEIANLADNKKTMELAAQRYIMLVLKLVVEYGLKNEYRDYRNHNTGYNQKKFAKTYKNNVKKHNKNNTKTID